VFNGIPKVAVTGLGGESEVHPEITQGSIAYLKPAESPGR